MQKQYDLDESTAHATIDRIKKQKANDEFLYLKKPEAATDEYKCSRCKQRRCIYTELQTRAIDEPMTKYITCLECNHKWQIAG